jgi:hypothetical protein
LAFRLQESWCLCVFVLPVLAAVDLEHFVLTSVSVQSDQYTRTRRDRMIE